MPALVTVTYSSTGSRPLAHRPAHAVARTRPVTCQTPATGSIVCAQAGAALTIAITAETTKRLPRAT